MKKIKFGLLVLVGIFLFLNILINIPYGGEVTRVTLWLNRYQNEYSNIHYAFYTDVWGTYIEFESIILASPLNNTYSLSLSVEGDQWGSGYEGTQSEIESLFKDGIYTFDVTYKDATAETINVELEGTLPEFPQNLSIEGNLVTWDEWVNPVSPYQIELGIIGPYGEDIILENLLYTDTSFIIPEGVLKYDTLYDLELWFISSENPSAYKASVSNISFEFDQKPANFSDYYPLSLGSYWVYQHAGSTDTHTDSVFEELTYQGNPAVKRSLFEDSRVLDLICSNDGSSVTFYGYYVDGVWRDIQPDLSIGDFIDGSKYQKINDGSVVLRPWDNLDPIQKSVYNIDQSFNDIVLWIDYDCNFSSNAQNIRVESNPQGVSFPDCGVTHLSWHQRGIGEIASQDVNADTGELEERYDLIDYYLALCKGDIDGDGDVDLADATLALQVLAGIEPSTFVYKKVDVNGDDKIGIEEVIYALQCAAKIRKECPNIDNDKDGYTENQGDCDDNDPSINPGGTEVCGDGIDQDCQGGDLTCLNGVWRVDSSTEWVDGEGCETDEYPYIESDLQGVGGGTATVSVYVKISNNNTVNGYLKFSDSQFEDIPDGVYVCPEREEKFTIDGNRIIFEEDVVNEATFEISGNTLTVTDEVIQGCQQGSIQTKVDESEIAGAIENCDAFQDDEQGGATTVTGTLTFPSEANGKQYWVLIDDDTNGDNGYVGVTASTCGSGTTVDYSIGSVPAGTYYVYAGVRVVSGYGSPPESGDYFGFYGTGSIPPNTANAEVPALGTVTFDIALSICCSWL